MQYISHYLRFVVLTDGATLTVAMRCTTCSTKDGETHRTVRHMAERGVRVACRSLAYGMGRRVRAPYPRDAYRCYTTTQPL